MEQQKKPVFEKKDIDENKTMAAISYLWVLCLVPLLTKKDSPFVQAHAKQGLVLFIVEVIGTFVFWIPIFGQLLALVVLIVAIVGFVKALNGEYWEIPGVKEILKAINL
jgi:fumarate reductase subunit D